MDNLEEPPEIPEYTAKLSEGWGAGMLYLILKDHEGLPEQPHHYQCILNDKHKYQEGYHIFCSLSGRKESEKHPQGYRTATVSTHIPMQTQLSLLERDAKAQYIQQVQDQMRRTLQERLPEIYDCIEKEYPGSPRTFNGLQVETKDL